MIVKVCAPGCAEEGAGAPVRVRPTRAPSPFAQSLLFGWILWPFSGAILWAIVFAVVFAPLQRRLVRTLGGRVNTAALLTLLVFRS